MTNQARSATMLSKRFAAQKSFTMRSLWRLTLWGAAAASTLLVAVLVSRSEIGSQRVAVAVASLGGGSAAILQTSRGQVAAPGVFDAQAETKRLSESMRGLTADDNQLKSRLAAVEHNLDSVTGSIGQEPGSTNAAAARTSPSPWPKDAESAPPATNAAAHEPLALPSIAYGVDVGGAESIQALRTRWTGLHYAHPEQFSGLGPMVTLKATGRSSRLELRLVVGPIASVEAAARLCAALAPYRLSCQPTIMSGQHLALE